MKVTRVWKDHPHNCVVLQAEGPDDTRLNLNMDPRELHNIARVALGPPPFTPSIAEMELAISDSLNGITREDPREVYRQRAAVIVQDYLRRAFRDRAEVPEGAALAALDGKEWSEKGP